MATGSTTTNNIDTTRPFDVAEYYRVMRQHGLEPCAIWHDGKLWEGALIDLSMGAKELFDWALRGDPDRDLRRAHIAEVWAARPEGAPGVMLGASPELA